MAKLPLVPELPAAEGKEPDEGNRARRALLGRKQIEMYGKQQIILRFQTEAMQTQFVTWWESQGKAQALASIDMACGMNHPQQTLNADAEVEGNALVYVVEYDEGIPF